MLATNTHEGDLGWLAPPAQAGRRGRAPRRTPRSVAVPDPAPSGDALGWSTWHLSSTASTRRSASSPAPSARPGQRTFFLQARAGARVVSVALEKQQVAALAERIDELLDEVMASERPRRR